MYRNPLVMSYLRRDRAKRPPFMLALSGGRHAEFFTQSSPPLFPAAVFSVVDVVLSPLPGSVFALTFKALDIIFFINRILIYK